MWQKHVKRELSLVWIDHKFITETERDPKMASVQSNVSWLRWCQLSGLLPVLGLFVIRLFMSSLTMYSRVSYAQPVDCTMWWHHRFKKNHFPQLEMFFKNISPPWFQSSMHLRCPVFLIGKRFATGQNCKQGWATLLLQPLLNNTFKGMNLISTWVCSSRRLYSEPQLIV